MLNPTHSLTHLHELIVTKLVATGSDWEREDTSTWQGCHWWSVGPCGSHWCCKEKFGLSRTVGSSLLRLHTLSWHLSRWAGENVRCCRSRWSVYHSASSSNAVVTREIIISAFVGVCPKRFLSARGNLPEVISGDYCSWWIFSNIFNVAEIILKWFLLHNCM